MRIILVVLAAFVFTSCDSSIQDDPQTSESESRPAGDLDSAKLATILDNQDEAARARYTYRHPGETLEFFEIKPGMTVVDVLPEGGWYSKILLPYLGSTGRLIGADYALDMYPQFGFYDDAFLEARKTWINTWTTDAETWRTPDSAQVTAFVMGNMPAELNATADAVLFIRALHNLNNYEGAGGYLSDALANAFDILKPGGILGIVQHEAMDNMPDDWANGSNGYLKRQHVMAVVSSAGFEFVSASDVNANVNDRPSEEEYVWRLPPSYDGAGDDPALRAAVDEIGESNRMTLKFRKPN